MKVFGFITAPLAFVALLSSVCETRVSAQTAVVQQKEQVLDGQEPSNTVNVPVTSAGLNHDGVEDRGWVNDAGTFFSDVVPNVIWGKVTAISGDVGDFSKNQLQDMEKQFKGVSHHIAELQERMQHVLAASQKLRGEVSARAEQHGFTIEDFSQELEGHWAIAAEELKGMFDPVDEAPSHDDRLKLAESVFDKAGAGLVIVGAKFGIAESETGAFCEAARPHVVHIVTVIGDVLEQHPILLEVLLPLVLGWIIGEVWILRSLLRLFGFGPAGPVKGGVAACIQRALFRGTVPAGGWFASLQSAGMKGVGKVGSTVGGAIVGVIAGAAAGAVAGSESNSSHVG